MESVWTWAVGLLLGLWFAASVAQQIWPESLSRNLSNIALGLIPRWRFFAPNPVRDDTHIVFRDQCGGTWNGWQVLTPAAGPRGWRWIWHPQRYPIKAASDLANSLRLSMSRSRDCPEGVLLSSPYLGILTWVVAQPAPADVTYRQFAVVTSRGFSGDAQLDVLFVSEPHRVDPRVETRA